MVYIFAIIHVYIHMFVNTGLNISSCVVDLVCICYCYVLIAIYVSHILCICLLFCTSVSLVFNVFPCMYI